jgi:DNA polymerase/3'-5' exonuclease PolX
VEEFLLKQSGVRRATAVGDYRRRVEVLEELDVLVETSDFRGLVKNFQSYGGRTPLISTTKNTAIFALSAGVSLRVNSAPRENWGLSLIEGTDRELLRSSECLWPELFCK